MATKNDKLADSIDLRNNNSRDAIWHGQCCYVPLCTHSSGEQTERKHLLNDRISFHSFPDLQTEKDRARQWIIKIKRDPGAKL